MELDCVIRGGLLATASGSYEADVGIAGEAIAAIGDDLPRAAREIDARGLVVAPGAVDVHTHLDQPFAASGNTTADDFESGTRAAAAGGITTVVNFAFQDPGDNLRVTTERHLERAAGRAHIDYGAHLTVNHANVPGVLDEIAALADEGFASVKTFTVTDDYGLRDSELVHVLRRCGELGILVNVHAEDDAMVDVLTAELLARGQSGVEHLPASRPPEAEAVATARVAGYARALGCAVYFVHLSSRAALEAVARARADGAEVYVETRPTYLFLDESRYALPDNEGAKYVCMPPLRALENQPAIWEGLRSGAIQTYATDHSPWLLAEKMQPGIPFTEIPAGIANLQSAVGMLYAEGVGKGRISLERFVAVTSKNPAKLFGLWPRKGALTVGADADLMLIDPTRRFTLTAAAMESRADYDPYEGFACMGWPTMTISRGEVVYEDGAIVSQPGRGRFLQRGRYQPI